MSLIFNDRLRTLFAPPGYLALPLSGIDLSTSGVKAVRLALGAHGLTLANYVETRLPAGVFADGEIIDHDSVIEALTEATEATGISAAHVALPESKSYLFETTVTGSNKEEWNTAIEQHLDEFVPLPPPETMFDFIEMGKSGQGDTFVAGVGFARRIVEDTLEVFDHAGIGVRSFEGETFASSRAYHRCRQDNNKALYR
jgi:Tfp pilus assembly PilM family ATPase